MTVFPDADKWWIIKECKDMKLKFEDHSISERICNYMFENPYPKRGEFKGNNKLIGRATSKRPYSNDSAEADTSHSSGDHPDSKNTCSLKEPIVPQKIRKTTDMTFKVWLKMISDQGTLLLLKTENSRHHS